MILEKLTGEISVFLQKFGTSSIVKIFFPLKSKEQLVHLVISINYILLKTAFVFFFTFLLSRQSCVKFWVHIC